MKRNRMSLLILTLAILIGMAGCSSGNKAAENASVKVAVTSAYVLDEGMADFEQQLREAFPAMNQPGSEMLIQWVSAGDSAQDPAGTMAGMTRMMGMFSMHEIEVLICDMESAERYAENGEMYVPLNELFSDEEQEQLGIVPVSIVITDEEGNETGEKTEPCGVDLSGKRALLPVNGTGGLSAYVIEGSENMENAKEILAYLAGLE